MKTHRTYLFWVLSLFTVLLITGCSSADKAGTQARTDLTSDHVRGLYSGMARKDVEDLLGTGDKSLADHEKLMYIAFLTVLPPSSVIVMTHY